PSAALVDLLPTQAVAWSGYCRTLSVGDRPTDGPTPAPARAARWSDASGREGAAARGRSRPGSSVGELGAKAPADGGSIPPPASARRGLRRRGRSRSQHLRTWEARMRDRREFWRALERRLPEVDRDREREIACSVLLVLRSRIPGEQARHREAALPSELGYLWSLPGAEPDGAAWDPAAPPEHAYVDFVARVRELARLSGIAEAARA